MSKKGFQFILLLGINGEIPVTFGDIFGLFAACDKDVVDPGEEIPPERGFVFLFDGVEEDCVLEIPADTWLF